MRRASWVGVGIGAIVVSAIAYASLRPSPPDDFAAYRQFIRSDVTTVYRSDPAKGLQGTTRYRSLYIQSKDPNEVYRIAHEVAAKRRWSIWRGLSFKDDFYACDPALLDPPAELQATTEPSVSYGHTAVIHDIRRVSLWEEWMLRIRNGGRDATHAFK